MTTPPPHNRSTPWKALLFTYLVALLALGFVLVRDIQPVPMYDLHLTEGERLKCVSYAPYHLPGQSPLDPTQIIPREQIAADLAALAKITECVRIYSVDQGLEQVPELARAVGLKVLLGAWIGGDPKRNMVQLGRAITLANDYADVVRVLIVGNEVLLRHERSEDEMRELIEYAKARVHVPVTYADVWEFWLKHRGLAASVDRVTVHILPFWEDNPVAIEGALKHVGEVYDEIRHTFDKPVMIGETGWPSAGRQREGSLPSLVNQARFIREFVHQAHANGWEYNLIEAIDQPWKRKLEGTVGGYWGMLNTQLQAKFPLAGPVSERSSLNVPLIAAGVGAVLCVLFAATAQASLLRLLVAGITGAVTGVVAALHWEHAQFAYRDTLEWTVLGAIAAIGSALPLLLARWDARRPLPSVAIAWQSLRIQPSRCCETATLLGLIRGMLLFACAVAALLLFADPRYRDFPVLLYLVPALTFGALAWKGQLMDAIEERVCALVIAITVIGRWLTEPANPQAIAWLLTGLLFSLPYLRPYSRTITSSESSSPTAAKL
ncbi:MAG TPA: beta-1,6-glucan synthase [Aromatoleum sp.]|uniref:glycoside hydrolase family 17 protein n=1 Tax=Aromatoleum sp. TaxID=2307007 RepID=UPI002B45FDCC|nr:beta-1,6-glucan synthase [Aromatoleum sp.]HJV25745.1 beta-1,6-glucan synthase [Aromatoleum sp.]